MPGVTLSSIIERDVDFLLMEELVASPDFLSWFARTAGLRGKTQIVSATHSSTSATGETDIELRLDCGGDSVFLLIENKVDAPLQLRQAERYRERAERYVKQGACAKCLTGLVAPARYLGDERNSLGFDFTVEYEQVLDWYSKPLTPRDHRPFRAAILRRALDRGAIGWTLVPHEGVTEFWKRYWDLARALAPELQMPKPAPKAATSAFVFFKPSGLAKGIKLIHKARYGNVDIQFDGQADQLEKLSKKYVAALEPGMTLQRANKSAVVRIEVQAVDPTLPFSELESAVREGIWAAKLLLLWYRGLAQRAASSPRTR